MLRRIGWTVPLLLGALVCLAGCTFPKSFGFARKQQRQPETQVAEDRAAATASDTEAEGPKPSLAQSLRKTTGWFSFGRRKPASTDKQPLVDNREPPATASQPLAYPNVVPPKYRNMGTDAPSTSLAKDTSGTPSLVRPSRRPPPDPAPKPPLDARQETRLAEKPRAEGPLYDILAAARESWRVAPRDTVATAPESAASDNAVPNTASPRQLATETHLKFTSPDLSARERNERKTVTKPTDIVTNMLRPAKSVPSAADKSTPASAAHTAVTHRAESNTRPVPDTSWIAKKTLPSSATPGASAPTVPADPRQTSATAVAPGDAAASTVVANTFGGTAGKPHTGSPTPPPATREVVTEIVRSQSVQPHPKPAGPAVTIPDRSEAVARAETARQEMPTPRPRAYLTKTPSQAHPSVPTRAAAPPAALEEETLAPLVDADTYRARFANTPSTRPAPVHTAARESTQPVPGSWVAAYHRLVQRTGSPPSPRPPAGSPTRTLSSDDGPAIPQPDAPILRR